MELEAGWLAGWLAPDNPKLRVRLDVIHARRAAI
jgi:hypothetical protein